MSLVEDLKDKLKEYEDTLPSRKQFQDWSKALRSGEYFQTSGELYNRHGHCCIGVYGSSVCGVDYSQMESEDLNTSLLEGVQDDVSFNFFMEFGEIFANANDSEGYTFEGIADAIEKVFL